MTDDSKLMLDAAKGRQAQSLLDNPLLQEIYQQREADLTAAWIATKPQDTEARERCWRQLHENRLHRDYLFSYVSNGKLAAIELTKLAENAERAQRWENVR